LLGFRGIANKHRAQHAAVAEDSPAVFPGELPNNVFAVFCADRRPNALQLLGPDKTALLGLKRGFDFAREGLHLGAAIGAVANFSVNRDSP